MTVLTTMKISPLLILALVNAASCQSIQCPGPYHAVGSGCYTFPDTNCSWFDANLICQYSGGYLAKIDSEEEEMYLTAHHNEYYYETFASRWIGATDHVPRGSWRWAPSGATLVYNNWGPGHPVPTPSGTCATWSPVFGHWMPSGCCESYSVGPVCEADPL